MIFVVGPGRSGTSTVARILHEKLGVSMGESFRDPDDTNPQGYYEDLSFKDLNMRMLSGGIPLDIWKSNLKALMSQRKEPCGLKDPRLCYLLGHYLELAQDALLIRTHRPAHLVASSMSRCYKWPYVDSLQETIRRETMLDALVAGRTVYEINFSQQISDEELEEKIHARLETYQSHFAA